MNLVCTDIIDSIRADFGQLWDCRPVGESLAISTPYMLPNHDSLTLFVTMRGERIIVADGGKISQMVQDLSSLNKEQMESCLDYFMEEHEVKSHQQSGRPPCFFKEASDIKLVSSMIFDLGNFAVNYCTAALPYSEAEEAVANSRFSTKADEYLKTLTGRMDRRMFQKKLEDLPNATFGAVISDPDFSRLWLVGYVSGSSPYHFTHNLASVYINFRFVRRSKKLISRSSLITLVNNNAAGYRPEAQREYFSELLDVTGQEPIGWTQKEELIGALGRQGPSLEAWPKN